MSIQTYDQALDFWYRRVNYEQRGMPSDVRELTLDRIRALLERLGNPHDQLRIIHIAGSKGKGSTAAMLEAVFRHAGYRTGLFTSPHLTRVEERCQVNGQPILADELITLMQEIERAAVNVEMKDSRLTFFEIVTALGFLHFARNRVDFAVVEVGLGGRFDSTNVCTPLGSIITSISLDHTQQLGTHLASIAREKAGIIKPRCPVVSGVTPLEARAVIEQVAARHDAPLYQLERDFDFAYEPGWVNGISKRRSHLHVHTASRDWRNLEAALLGEHQAANAAIVIACVEQLQQLGVAISEEAVRTGLREVHWPARMEVMCREPMVILDCAHNVASVQALVDTLQRSFPPCRRLLVFAASADKDLAGMLQALGPHFQTAYFTRYTSSPRSASPEELATIWRAAGGSCGVFATPADAWHAAQRWAKPNHMICIAGSVFLAGELRPLLLG